MHKRLSTFCQVVLWSPFWPSLLNAKCKDFLCIMKNYLLTLNTIDENCKTFSSEATQRCRNAPKKTKTTLASRLFCSRWWLYHQFNGGKKKFYLLCNCTLTYWAQVHFFRFGKAIIIYQVSRTREGDLPELSPFFFSVYLKRYKSSYFEIVKAMAFQSPCVLNSIVNYLLTIVSL